jgi:hypothetical protein
MVPLFLSTDKSSLFGQGVDERRQDYLGMRLLFPQRAQLPFGSSHRGHVVVQCTGSICFLERLGGAASTTEAQATKNRPSTCLCARLKERGKKLPISLLELPWRARGMRVRGCPSPFSTKESFGYVRQVATLRAWRLHAECAHAYCRGRFWNTTHEGSKGRVGLVVGRSGYCVARLDVWAQYDARFRHG